MPMPLPTSSLKEIKNELESIFALTVVGIAHIYDRKIVRCNRHMEEIFGFAPGEMLGSSTRIWYCSDEDFLHLGGSAYSDLSAGQVHNREQYFQRKDGSKFWGRIAGRAPNPARPYDCVLLIEDNTEHKEAQERLQAALYQQQLMFNNAAVGILFVRDHRVQSCNRRFEEIFGYGPGELNGHPTRALYVNDDMCRAHRHAAYDALRRGEVFTSEVEVQRRDGRAIWVQATGRRIERGEADSHAVSVIWIIEDVTERHEAEAALARYQDELESRVRERTAELAAANERLQVEIQERREAEKQVWHIANHDALTNLPNRSLFQDRLNQALALAQRRQEKIALVFVDLDRFKSINDTLGHHVGDQLLWEIARRLLACLRASDTVARLGGDEFVIILPSITDTEEVAGIVEKMRNAVLQPVVLDERSLLITASMGISIYPDHGTDSATLMRNADIAMYHAKDNGRNALQFFSSGMSLAASRFFHIESRLAQAIAKGQLSLHYQPLVDIESGRMVGLEALLRWKDGEQFISPADFIPVAEETGLILPIGEWVLKKACTQMAAWHQEYGHEIVIAVNLSPRQFRQPNLVEVVRAVLAETGLPPSSLELEITETALMERVDDTRVKLDEFSKMGIRLAVDDFGTGYSSLNYLKRFPVDKLKVDQSFVRDLCNDPDDASIVSAIVSLARSLGLSSLAEGVETPEQLEVLKDIGCGLCQGYHFSRPLAADDISRLLQHPLDEQLDSLRSKDPALPF